MKIVSSFEAKGRCAYSTWCQFPSAHCAFYTMQSAACADIVWPSLWSLVGIAFGSQYNACRYSDTASTMSNTLSFISPEFPVFYKYPWIFCRLACLFVSRVEFQTFTVLCKYLFASFTFLIWNGVWSECVIFSIHRTIVILPKLKCEMSWTVSEQCKSSICLCVMKFKT